MSLRDRITDLEKKFGADKNVFQQKCEEYAERHCRFAVRCVEKAIENKEYKVKGLFTKTKYVEGYFGLVYISKNCETVSPEYLTIQGDSDYYVRNSKEAREFIACVVSRLEEEGFKCEIEHRNGYWCIKHIFEWK